MAVRSEFLFRSAAGAQKKEQCSYFFSVVKDDVQEPAGACAGGETPVAITLAGSMVFCRRARVSVS